MRVSYGIGLVSLVACASGASAQLYSEYISGDLPNVPFAAPMVPVTSPGVTFAAAGVIVPMAPDVDFITISVTFPTTQLLFDLDHLPTPLEDAVMGIGAPGQYPIPSWVNDDDNDSPLDAICGHASAPRDCLLDVGALLGNPAVIAPGTYTVAIGRKGEDTSGWTGFSNMVLKLEYQLYVYAVPVPAPGAAGLLGVAACTLAARRRRG
jgi:hypothetical protein